MPLTRRQTVTPAPYVVPPTQQFDGNDGSWSTFSIHVGTPGQDFRVLVSTASSETWLPVPEGCLAEEPSDCPSLRGAEPFNSAQSPGFQYDESSSWEYVGLYGIDVEAELNYTANGLYGYDRVGLGSVQNDDSLSIDRQVVAGIADKDYFMGVLGLGIRPTSFSSTSEPVPGLLENLYNQSLIPSASYSYTAGAKYRFRGQLGTLILGGYDETKFKSDAFSFAFAQQETRSLTVGVRSIVGADTILGVASLTDSGHLSVIDSTVPHLWLPETVCDAFEGAFGLTYDPSTGLYLVNDTIHAELLALNPTITIKLGVTQYDDGDSVNIELPYAAFDQQAGWPIYSEPTNYFPIRRAANDSQLVLGRTLLQEAHLIVDHERQNFSIAQVEFADPPPEPNIIAIRSLNSTESSDSDSSSGLGTGAIAGISVGAAAVVLAIAGLIIFLLLRRRRRSRGAELADTQKKEEVEGQPKGAGAGAGASDVKEADSGYPADKPQELYSPGLPADRAHELPSSEIQELASPTPYQSTFHKSGGPAPQELPSPTMVHELPAETDRLMPKVDPTPVER